MAVKSTTIINKLVLGTASGGANHLEIIGNDKLINNYYLTENQIQLVKILVEKFNRGPSLFCKGTSEATKKMILQLIGRISKATPDEVTKLTVVVEQFLAAKGPLAKAKAIELQKPEMNTFNSVNEKADDFTMDEESPSSSSSSSSTQPVDTTSNKVSKELPPRASGTFTPVNEATDGFNAVFQELTQEQ